MAYYVYMDAEYKDSDYRFIDDQGNAYISSPEYSVDHIIIWAFGLMFGFFIFMNLVLWFNFGEGV